MIDHALSVIVKHLSRHLKSLDVPQEPVHNAVVLMNPTDLSSQPREAQYLRCAFCMLSVGHPQGLGNVSPVTHVTEIGEL